MRLHPCSARLIRAGALVFCSLAFLSPSFAQPELCPPQFLGDYPKEAEEDWTDDCQGITHDDTHWYINQRRVLFRIPVERDLWQSHKNEPGVSFRHIDDIPELDGYDHMGGSGSFEYNGTWYIVVPVDQGPGDALLAFFRADASLAVVGTATAPGLGTGCGWVAFGPDGMMYTSVSGPTVFKKYSVNWSTIETNGPVLSFVGDIPITDENGDPYQLFHMQGGAVNPDNTILFIANGLGDCFFSGGGEEEESFGLHAFDITTGQRILRSCQSGCVFRFQFNSCSLGFPDEEPEGITFWDLDNGAAPGVGGQLHTILLDNDLGTSDVYLKHYRVGALTAGIACPQNIVVECSQEVGTPKTDPQLAGFFDVAATTLCDQSIAVTNDAPDLLPHGQTTTVTFTADDGQGTVLQCSATITVEDTTPPEIACPADIVVECADACGTPATDLQLSPFVATATDICDGDVDVVDDRPTCFPFGDTMVQFIATDHEGLADTCAAKVTVVDTTPPDITIELDRDVLWPPNHKMVTVCATVTVTDACDPNATFELVAVTSNEPDDDTGDGHFPNDIQDVDGEQDTCFDLRSERVGAGNGRIYRITYRATDSSGNEALASADVRVANDHGANALASTGFLVDGKAFAPVAESFAVIIPAVDGMDAAALDRSQIMLGNTAGIARPDEIRVVEVDDNGRPDLALFFSVARAKEILAPDDLLDERQGGVTRGREGNHGPLGIHFVSATGLDCLIPNIFALGEPVEMPIIGIDHPPVAFDEREPAAPKETSLRSIHPNPFNPQTTIAFSLVGEGTVRIVIYDVRGSIVRRLVDEAMPAGEHSAVWNGADDAGSPVSSGIYFVRMTAGGYAETKKIVMLK